MNSTYNDKADKTGGNMIDKADSILLAGKKKLLPIVLIVLIITVIEGAGLYYAQEKNSSIMSIVTLIWSFVIFPITNLGIANYSLRIIKGEKASTKDIFKYYRFRVKDSLYLSLIMTIILGLPMIINIVRSFGVTGDSIAYKTINLVVSICLSIKLVLVPFIFVENEEMSVTSMISKAWKLSKGRSMEIISIYLKILMVALIFVMVLSVVGFAISFALPVAVIIISMIALMFVSFISIYRNLAFASFAIEVLEE